MQSLTASRLSGSPRRGTANPILAPGAGGTWDEFSLDGPCAAIKVGTGDYRMWYEGFDDPLTASSTGLATSSDGTTWTKYGSNPVMTASEAWEGDEASISSVTWDPIEETFKSWYHGGGNALSRAIGYATSDDGITWTKYGSNPILQKGTSGQWDDKWVADCKVIRVSASDYRMWYGGVKVSDSLRQFGYATSSDGISWTKYGSNPIFTRGSAGAWDAGDIHAFCPYLLGDGTFAAWYIGRNTSFVTGIGYAYSSDGITWTKGPYNPVYLQATGDVPANGIQVYEDGDDLRIVYGQDTGHQKFEAKMPLVVITDPPTDVSGLVDDFNRADDTTPPPGANWANGVVTFTGGLDIISNTLRRHTGATAQQGATYTASTFGPDHYLVFDLAAAAAGEGFRAYLRLANVGAGTTDGYYVNVSGTNGQARLSRVDNTTGTALTAFAFVPLTSGDVYALSAYGSRIQFWRKPAAGSWVPVLVADDATYGAAGYVGFDVIASAGQSLAIDNMRVFAVTESVPYTVINGSDEQLVDINAAGDDVAPNSFKDGIVLTSAELAALLDGSSFGQRDIAVFPDLTGAAGKNRIKQVTLKTFRQSA